LGGLTNQCSTGVTSEWRGRKCLDGFRNENAEAATPIQSPLNSDGLGDKLASLSCWIPRRRFRGDAQYTAITRFPNGQGGPVGEARAATAWQIPLSDFFPQEAGQGIDRSRNGDRNAGHRRGCRARRGGRAAVRVGGWQDREEQRDQDGTKWHGERVLSRNRGVVAIAGRAGCGRWR
jgi:hypothetical protein